MTLENADRDSRWVNFCFISFHFISFLLEKPAWFEDHLACSLARLAACVWSRMRVVVLLCENHSRTGSQKAVSEVLAIWWNEMDIAWGELGRFFIMVCLLLFGLKIERKAWGCARCHGNILLQDRPSLKTKREHQLNQHRANYTELQEVENLRSSMEMAVWKPAGLLRTPSSSPFFWLCNWLIDWLISCIFPWNPSWFQSPHEI